MDIKAIPPSIPEAPATAPAPEANRPQVVERNLQRASGAAAEAAPGPHIVHTHAELAFDAAINRVVGRIVNEQTGETIHEFPPDN